MYKVQEVARICGVSASAIYKAIKVELDTLTTSPIDGQIEFEAVDNQSNESGRVDNQSNPYIVVENGINYITDEGLEYFKQRFASTVVHQLPATDELVSSLLKQLENRDKQIEEKDKQIATLMEQARNYQVLLKQEQDSKLLLLESPKRLGWFSRLFGRTNSEG